MKPECGVLLINPKYPHNVGGAVRAAAAFGVRTMRWTGGRVDARSRRLPREERLSQYAKLVDFQPYGGLRPLNEFDRMTPVCIELLDGAESLWTFEHPERAVYVFGPEDGDVPKGMRHACHHFVSIPTIGGSCLNLAAAVNVVLASRALQLHLSGAQTNELVGKMRFYA